MAETDNPRPPDSAWKWIATICATALISTFSFYFLNYNSVASDSRLMQQRITGCEQALADQKHEIDQIKTSITDLQATNSAVEERLRWIMALPSSSDYRAPAPRKSTPK